MQRPIMDPTFSEEPTCELRRWRWWGSVRAAMGPVVGFLCNDLFRRFRGHPSDGPDTRRFLRALSYRLLFLPLIGVLLAAALVYQGTHGPSAAAAIDPTCLGIYYDTVNYLGEGNVQLEAWMVPALDAQRVLAERDRVLGDRRPAVVMVHDDGASRQQMMPLVAPLHHQGYVVMVVSLRGCEGNAAGSTFGLNEAGDVVAALAVVQKTALVDPNRLAIIGLGTGANAALIAAQHNPSVRALVIDDPHPDFDIAFANHVGEQRWWTRAVDPLCRWTFEVAYGVNAADLNLQHCLVSLQDQPQTPAILQFDGSGAMYLKPEKRSAVLDFLAANLLGKPDKN